MSARWDIQDKTRIDAHTTVALVVKGNEWGVVVFDERRQQMLSIPSRRGGRLYAGGYGDSAIDYTVTRYSRGYARAVYRREVAAMKCETWPTQSDLEALAAIAAAADTTPEP